MTVTAVAASPSISSRFLRRHWALVGLVMLGALVVYLAGNNLFPLVDRDEPRYAQASRQMLASDDWTVPTYLDGLRLKKPILIYWLQATSMRFLGDTAFAARLPSTLAAMLTLGVFAAVLPGIVGHRRAFWTLFIFATSVLPAYIAKVCMTDAVLHLWIAIAMLCLYAIWRGTARWPTLLVLGVAMGLAVLTKGPPVFLFLGMTLVALWLLNQTIDAAEPTLRVDLDRFVPRVFVRTILVFGLATLVCLPWARSLEARHPGALVQMFMTEVVERGRRGQEGHAAPPGFYFITFWGTYLPWCLFWPAALYQGWKRRHLPWVRFSLAATLGPWAFLEIYRTKLPHYWLPSYPFMAILTADVLLRGARGRIVDLCDKPFLIGAAVWAGFVGAGIGLFVLVVPFFGDRPWHGYAAAIALAAGLAVGAWGVYSLLISKRILHAAVVMGLASWAIVAFIACLYWPATNALTLPSRVAAALREIGATVPGQVQMIEYKEPSLAFYQGGTIREQSSETYLADHAAGEWPIWTVIDDADWQKMPADVQLRMIVRRTLRGSNIADGKKHVTVQVLEKKIVPKMLPATLPNTLPSTRP